MTELHASDCQLRMACVHLQMQLTMAKATIFLLIVLAHAHLFRYAPFDSHLPRLDVSSHARSGGTIARAASKKDKLAFCGYHGWHDWYLAANHNEVPDKGSS